MYVTHRLPFMRYICACTRMLACARAFLVVGWDGILCERWHTWIRYRLMHANASRNGMVATTQRQYPYRSLRTHRIHIALLEKQFTRTYGSISDFPSWKHRNCPLKIISLGDNMYIVRPVVFECARYGLEIYKIDKSRAIRLLLAEQIIFIDPIELSCLFMAVSPSYSQPTTPEAFILEKN